MKNNAYLRLQVSMCKSFGVYYDKSSKEVYDDVFGVPL